MEAKQTACVDLDGVLATYDGWQGVYHIGDARPGARDFLRSLRARFRVVIFTTRCKVDMPGRDEAFGKAGMPLTEPQAAGMLRDIVVRWLTSNKLPFDEVYVGQGKPVAAVYFDDRAVRVPTNPTEADFAMALAAV